MSTAFRPVWSYRIPGRNPFLGSYEPVVDGGRVFFTMSAERGTEAFGALDARTGRVLWRRSIEIQGGLRLVIGGGRLVVAGVDELWQIDPQDGHTVWQTDTSPYAVGPFLVGDRMIAETTWGRLQAFDLDSHRPLWTLRYSSEIGGFGRERGAVVADGILWAQAGDDRIIRVSLADGHLAFARPFGGGRLVGMVPMRGAMALLGETGTEAWRASDGALRWRSAGRFPGTPFYAFASDELWTVRSGDGRLVRFRSKDGRRIGETVAVASGFGPTPRLVAYGDGAALLGTGGLMRLGKEGRVIGSVALPFRPRGVTVVGRDLIGPSEEGFARFYPTFFAPGEEPSALIRRLSAAKSWHDEDRRALLRLGHRAVPLILAARRRMDRESYGQGDDELLKVADARDTAAVLPILEENGGLYRDPYLGTSPGAVWLRTQADPDRLAEWLLPHLRAASDPAIQARFTEFMVRSARPEIVAELRMRLLTSWSDARVKRTVYGGFAASGSPAATETILALRRNGPFPSWIGAAPPPATSETQKALAAAFDARMRFEPVGIESLALDYGSNLRPFAVVGWRGGLRIAVAPAGQIARMTARIPPPYVAFLPLDLDGTMVRFEKGGTEATARIAVAHSSENVNPQAVRLRKIRGEWFVVSLEPTSEEIEPRNPFARWN